MLGHRELTMEDYTDILKRRIWLILASALTFLAIGVALTFVLHPQFQSQTMILIEEQKVPEDYVKPVVEQDLSSRLASMKEQILSRSRIEPIIRQYDLFDGKNASMDDRVALMQKAIGIKPIQSNQDRGMPGFSVTFTAADPRIAQKVCGEITSIFISENLSSRQASAEGTTEFLRQQLNDSKKSLDDQEAKLAAFQQKYFGRLPDQEQSNTNTLQTLTTQLEAVTQSLSRQQQDVTFLQAMVAQQTHENQVPQSELPAAINDDRKAQLNALIQQRQVLQAQYTPDHPDVVEVSRKIAQLQDEIARSGSSSTTAPAAAPISRPDTPQLQQLKAQLRGAQQAMADGKAEQTRLEEQVKTYESRIESSPEVEEQYKQITRDHDTALEFYNSLLKKMNESSMATALEQRQQGEQFRVMDAPNLPQEPIFPNRIRFAGVGLVGGIFLGFALAGLLEYRDTSVRNERDLWAFTKLPTLAVISHVEGLPLSPKSRSRWNPFANARKPIESALG